MIYKPLRPVAVSIENYNFKLEIPKVSDHADHNFPEC